MQQKLNICENAAGTKIQRIKTKILKEELT